MYLPASKKLWDKPKSNKFIYGLIDPTTKELKYIGKTVRGVQRLRDHVKETRVSPRSGMKSKKVNWINKLKNNNLIFDVIYLEYCESESDLNEAEVFYINYFKSIGSNLLNLSPGGESSYSHIFTKEEKLNLSNKMKLIMNTPEVLKKCSESHKGQVSHNKGKKSSPETITKIKLANAKRAIKVIDNNGVVYESLLDASKKVGCTPTDVRNCLINPNKIVKGLKFRKLI